VPGAVVPGGVGAGGAPTAAAPVRVGASTFTKAAPEQTSSAAGTAPCPGCDVVVITVCSLRRDHVSGYGVAGHEGLTPSIDRIAADGWRMDNAWSASNFTLAGLSAILTGRFGSTTGVLTWDKGLTADIPTLPEILGYYGYATGGFTIDAPSGFRPDYGLDRGFQHMEIMPPPRDTPDGRTGGGSPGPGGDSARPAAAWLAKQSTSKPVFLMYHNRTAHFPFVLSEKGADGDPTGLIQALYDAGRTQAHRGPMPGTGKGNSGWVSRAKWSGPASTCGQSSGIVGPAACPQQRRQRCSRAGSAARSWRASRRGASASGPGRLPEKRSPKPSFIGGWASKRMARPPLCWLMRAPARG
jgi:hypothetical protein